MEMLIGLLFFLVVLVLLRISKINAASTFRPWFIPAAYALKCAVGLIFLQMYIFQEASPHEKNDAGAFYHEAQMVNAVYDESPSDYFKLITGIRYTDSLSMKYLGETNHWDSGPQAIFSDNRNVIRIHAIIDTFSRGSIVVHMLIFSLISLLGTLLLFLALRDHTALKPYLVFALLLLLPNILFWSSGILKETFVIFGIGAMAYGLMIKTTIVKRLALILLGLLALICFKPYIIMAGLAVLPIYLIYVRIPQYKLLTSLSIPLIAVTCLLVAFPSILEKGTNLLSRKQFDFSNLGRGGIHVEADSCFYYFRTDQKQLLRIEGDSVWLKQEVDACIVTHGDLIPPRPIHLKSNTKAWLMSFDQPPAESFIEIIHIDNHPERLLTSAPSALFSAFFRPLPSDPGGNLKYLAFLETIGLFSLIIWALFQHRTLTTKERAFILCSLLFCLLLALLIGWATPVLGAIHRYRVPIQLALICCIIVAWKPKLALLVNR